MVQNDRNCGSVMCLYVLTLTCYGHLHTSKNSTYFRANFRTTSRTDSIAGLIYFLIAVVVLDSLGAVSFCTAPWPGTVRTDFCYCFCLLVCFVCGDCDQSGMLLFDYIDVVWKTTSQNAAATWAHSTLTNHDHQHSLGSQAKYQPPPNCNHFSMVYIRVWKPSLNVANK